MNTVRQIQEPSTSKMNSDHDSDSHDPIPASDSHHNHQHSRRDAASANESIIEISDDDEISPQNHTNIPISFPGIQTPLDRDQEQPARSRDTPFQSVVDVEDEDDLLITGTNPNPSPLTVHDTPTSSHMTIPSGPGHEPADADEIQIINERPIARPPPVARRYPQRGPANVPSFEEVNAIAGAHFGVYRNGAARSVPGIRGGYRMPNNFWVPFSSTGRNTRQSERRQPPSNISERNLLSYLHRMLRQNPDFAEFAPNEAFGPDSNEIESSIMERIDRENESALDSRLANENLYNRKTLQEKKEQASHELKGYTNDIKPEDNPGCELCGVCLGEGLPEDFKPDSRYSESFEKYAKEYRVQAPWFCILQCTPTDIELSRRIFTSKCGHVFCGRCVRNIANRPKRTKSTPSGFSIENPTLVSPPKCPGQDCGKRFTVKTFVEIYY